MERTESTKHASQTSHKVLEKRRRDRINLCLAELSQTIPTAFMKQSSGKLEKAEILEMTVEYLRAIQGTESGIRLEQGEWFSTDIYADLMQHYETGYNDCIREILRYMTDVEGLNVSDERCVRLTSFLQTRFHSVMAISNAAPCGLAKNRFCSQFKMTNPCYTAIRQVQQNITAMPLFRPHVRSISSSIIDVGLRNTFNMS